MIITVSTLINVAFPNIIFSTLGKSIISITEQSVKQFLWNSIESTLGRSCIFSDVVWTKQSLIKKRDCKEGNFMREQVKHWLQHCWPIMKV